MFMKSKTKIQFAFNFLLILLWLFAGNSIVLGARVAGEEGVTSVTPKSEQKKQVTKKPGKTKRPILRPSKKKAIQTKDKITSIETPAKEKSQPGKQQPGNKKGQVKQPSKEFISIDFVDVDIVKFIKYIGELSNKNFIVDKGVSGKITVFSPTKISKKEAYKVFESVLEVYGYTTVPAGHITKIIPASGAKSKNIETRLKQGAISPEDKIITQLIPLKYANPADLKKLFDPFISKSSLIIPYEPTGTLIVTDVLSNIQRLIKILEVIDVEGIGEEITVMPLEYATASVLSKSLTSIFQKTGRRKTKGVTGGGSIKITSDERTNSLIIMASEDNTRKVKKLIKLLDAEIPRGEGDIHVYYLQNANAEELTSVLKAIPSDKKNAAKKGKAPIVSKDVRIVADKATNALVITANKADYAVLENVINKLDIPRRMVYIEALIMEVSVTKNFNIGVEWKIGDKDIGSYQGDKGAVGGYAASTTGSSFPGPENLPAGLAMGILGKEISIGDAVFSSIASIIQAYEKDTDVHILSTPQIMTTDNEEAQIMVADNIPFLTSRNTSDAEQDYSNYEYKDVGTTLTITPQINQKRFVRLKISQEVSQVVSASDDDRPTTLKRLAKTTVIVKDGHTVVIGGLIDETLTQGTSQVPCLGSIPGLGWLFKSFASTNKKTNLFIFITPHIVENPEEAAEVYKGKKEYIDKIKEGVVKMYEKQETKDVESEVEDIDK